MRKKPSDKILKEIDDFFALAKRTETKVSGAPKTKGFRAKESKQQATASCYVANARKLAKRNNLSLKPYRKLFCKKCSSFFTSDNSQIRINKGIKSIKCLKCGAYRRFKIS